MERDTTVAPNGGGHLLDRALRYLRELAIHHACCNFRDCGPIAYYGSRPHWKRISGTTNHDRLRECRDRNRCRLGANPDWFSEQVPLAACLTTVGKMRS